MFTIICLLLLVSYIVWQFKVIKKYAFKFDKFSIDTKNNLICINNERIRFRDINLITVEELDQPSMIEQSLTRSRWNYMTEMVFHLKNGTTRKCTLNRKGILYKNLKQLQQYIKVDANIDSYKQEGLSNWLTILLLIIGSIWIVVTLYNGINS